VAVELAADMGYYRIVVKLVVVGRASGLVKMGRDASVPGGELKVPCCGAGSSRRAGFHLNFEPQCGLKDCPMELGWERTPAKTIDTAGRLGSPLVTSTTGPIFPAPRWARLDAFV